MNAPDEEEIRALATMFWHGNKDERRAAVMLHDYAKLLKAQRAEERRMVEIGFLHRRRTGEIDFHQEIQVLPIAIHDTLKVFMEQPSDDMNNGE